jgi:hypothetical protein
MGANIIPEYYHYGLNDDFLYSLTELDDLFSFKAKIKIYTDDQAFKYLTEQSLTHLPDSRFSLKIDIGFLRYIKLKLIRDLKQFHGEAELEPQLNEKYRIRNLEALIAWIDDKQSELNQNSKTEDLGEKSNSEKAGVQENEQRIQTHSISEKLPSKVHALFFVYLELAKIDSPLNRPPLKKKDNIEEYAIKNGFKTQSFNITLSNMGDEKKRVTKGNRNNILKAIELLNSWPDAIRLAELEIKKIDSISK